MKAVNCGSFLLYSLNLTNNFPCCLFAIFSICAPSFAFIILQEEETTKKKVSIFEGVIISNAIMRLQAKILL